MPAGFFLAELCYGVKMDFSFGRNGLIAENRADGQKENKKGRMGGQALSLDFILACSALILVSALLLIQGGYVIKNISESGEKNRMMADLSAASEIFFLEGYPKGWTNESVIIMGLESEGRLNKTKMSFLKNMSYTESKSLIGIFYEYNITVSLDGAEVYSIGIFPDTAHYSSVLKMNRIAVLDGNIASVEVLVFGP
jgi:hypothetical protein